ncbi:MAG TPA: twin-arginine translocase TatA/TatE family subunit [Candidatus Saccharimonadales bacterium]|nr:twin-arginine translocase TatA/TatE family subunit [Candidatus Saccharimonadales bacterium]
MPEMIFIFLLALILFGPKKLPEIAREIGKFVAEFKRASNDFKYQLQNEIEQAGIDAGTVSQSGAQQTSSFTQTLLPPAVTSAISEIDSAHERLMSTARMAFDAQNFTLRPPDTPVVSSAYPESPSAPLPAEPSSEPSSSTAPVSADAASREASPVEASTDQPFPLHSAPAKSDSAPQNS